MLIMTLAGQTLNDTHNQQGEKYDSARGNQAVFYTSLVLIDPLTNGGTLCGFVVVNNRLVLSSDARSLGVFTGVAFCALFLLLAHMSTISQNR